MINDRNNRIQSCSEGSQFTVSNGMSIAGKLQVAEERSHKNSSIYEVEIIPIKTL